MNRIFRGILIGLGILYPIGIFLSLHFLKASPRILGFALLIFGVLIFIFRSATDRKDTFKNIQSWFMLIAAIILATISLLADQNGAVKLYPVLTNLFLLSSFVFTLFKGPPMIFRFALMQDKKLHESSDRPRIEKYCRKVTIVWCLFFLGNAIIATLTTFIASDEIWTLYNGLISYILIGILFGAEFAYRKLVLKV